MINKNELFRTLLSEYELILEQKYHLQNERWLTARNERHQQFSTRLRDAINTLTERELQSDELASEAIKRILRRFYIFTASTASAFKPKASSANCSELILATSDDLGMSTFFVTQIIPAAKQAINQANSAGVFTPWHYGMFSFMVSLSMLSLANSVRLAANSPNVNQNKVTGLSIQTGVAATLGTTVFGGFSMQALAVGGPIGFFVISGGMALKSLFDGVRNLVHRSRLRRRGYADTAAYRTYKQRAKAHFKSAIMHGLVAAGIGTVVTFAPYVAIPVLTFVSAAMATLKIYQAMPKIIAGFKKFAKWVRKCCTRADNQQQDQIDENHEAPQADIDIEHPEQIIQAIEDERQVEIASNWKHDRSQALEHSGLREYDKRYNYRDDQLMFIAKAHHDQPHRAVAVMRDRVLAILSSAMTEYLHKSQNPSFKVNAAQMRKKVALTRALAGMVGARGNTLSLSRLQALVKQHNGTWFVRGALGSFSKRVGGMQSVVEAVEFYMAFANANGELSAIDASQLHYQHGNAYSLTGQTTRQQISQQFAVRMFRPATAPAAQPDEQDQVRAELAPGSV